MSQPTNNKAAIHAAVQLFKSQRPENATQIDSEWRSKYAADIKDLEPMCDASGRVTAWEGYLAFRSLLYVQGNSLFVVKYEDSPMVDGLASHFSAMEAHAKETVYAHRIQAVLATRKRVHAAILREIADKDSKHRSSAGYDPMEDPIVDDVYANDGDVDMDSGKSDGASTTSQSLFGSGASTPPMPHLDSGSPPREKHQVPREGAAASVAPEKEEKPRVKRETVAQRTERLHAQAAEAANAAKIAAGSLPASIGHPKESERRPPPHASRMDALAASFSSMSVKSDIVAGARAKAADVVAKLRVDKVPQGSLAFKSALSDVKRETKVANLHLKQDKQQTSTRMAGGVTYDAARDVTPELFVIGKMEGYMSEISCGISHTPDADLIQLYAARPKITTPADNRWTALVRQTDFIRMQNGMNMTKSGTNPKQVPHECSVLRYDPVSKVEQRFVVLDVVTIGLLGKADVISDVMRYYDFQVREHLIAFAKTQVNMASAAAAAAAAAAAHPGSNSSSVRSHFVTPGGGVNV